MNTLCTAVSPTILLGHSVESCRQSVRQAGGPVIELVEFCPPGSGESTPQGCRVKRLKSRRESGIGCAIIADQLGQRNRKTVNVLLVPVQTCFAMELWSISFFVTMYICQ